MGGNPGSVLYDTVRVDDPSDFLASDCVEAASADLESTDTFNPTTGVAWYYLVIPENTCGTGPAGNDSIPHILKLTGKTGRIL